MMELKEFQQRKVEELKVALAQERCQEIVFRSPTGSGKTIVLTHLMFEVAHERDGVVFVWLSPGKGGLAEQSKEKMERYCHNASTKNLADVMTGGFAAGDFVFINWEKLTRASNNALKDSERTNFKEWVEKAHETGLHFWVVVDESHHNDSVKADEILELFAAERILRASATPKANPKAYWVEVPEWEVVDSGLIKKMIYINPDLPRKVELEGSEVDYLLEQAEGKRQALRRAYMAQGIRVNPLVIVQLPNGSDAPLEQVMGWYAARHLSVESGEVAVWLAIRKDNVEGLVANDAKPVVVIIKQAVATGWDCPRAQILVKLRENMDETFEIQTIGRIRRMPEAHHYGLDALDGCYLYTFDKKFTDGLRNELNQRALDAKTIYLKRPFREFELEKEQRTMVVETQDAMRALAALCEQLDTHYHLTREVVYNHKVLEAAGWEMSTKIVDRMVTGEAATLDDMGNGEQLQSGEVIQSVSTHRHGHDMHHAIGEIGQACALHYNEMRTILNRLFGEKGSPWQRLALPVRAFYAFIINNRDRLKEEGRKAMALQSGAMQPNTPVSLRPFRFPQQWEMTFDGNARNQEVAQKNVYKGYLRSAAPRSSGEIAFEKWCEECPEVEWVYRNGDKGSEYFSIVYTDNSGKERLFFPDYLLCVRQTLWILEVKGGFTPGGQSENIDRFAEKKAEALANYCRRHHLHGGFVCEDKASRELLLFENGYADDLADPNWKPLATLVQ
ncbi:MAG: DEAD/DEAH box helicase family protein [Candidatus Spyradenecus sp.]